MLETEKPKYKKLKDYIIEIISSKELQVGEKLYSENELAEKFEISRHTVRKALGELVNEGWLYKVQGKGTFVNRPPFEEPKKSKNIGVITTYLSDYIFPSIIRGIDSVLTENNYSLSLSCTYNKHDKERLCLENFITQDIAGLIVETTKSALPNPNIDIYRKLGHLGIPVLFIHGSYKELDYSYIVEDDTEAGYLATQHLIELGHTKIAGIFKIDDIQGHYRFSGFQKAHHEAGLEIPDSRVFWFDTSDAEGGFNSRSTGLKTLLTSCTALVCYNDQIALKLMDIMREHDLKIPDDISLVSFDDSQFAVASEVKLTTVAHPKEKLGEEAAKAILSMINRTKDYYDIKMKPELIVRGSTKIYKEE